MTKEEIRKIEKLLLGLKINEAILRSTVTSDLFREEVTRALEPTYSNLEREEMLQNISNAQKILNRQKNLLTKISKVLRSQSS